MYRSFRIGIIILSFFFLTGFVPIFSFIGPGVTVLTTGNVYKAAAQFMIDQSIKKTTGKNSLMLVKEEINKKMLVKEEINKKNLKYKNNKFNEELRKLVEKNIMITREKLDNQNLQKLVKERIEITRSILNLNTTTQ